jgi:hypothetical protein
VLHHNNKFITICDNYQEQTVHQWDILLLLHYVSIHHFIAHLNSLNNGKIFKGTFFITLSFLPLNFYSSQKPVKILNYSQCFFDNSIRSKVFSNFYKSLNEPVRHQSNTYCLWYKATDNVCCTSSWKNCLLNVWGKCKRSSMERTNVT